MQQWTRGNDSDWTSYIRIDQNDFDHMIGLDVLETQIIENILVGSQCFDERDGIEWSELFVGWEGEELAIRYSVIILVSK